MRIALLWSYYEPYLKDFYAARPQLASLSYAEQLAAMHADYFGVTTSYLNGFGHHGHEAFHILDNCEPLQRRWAEENGFPFDSNWRRNIALEQIKRSRPDILFMSSIFDLYGDFLEAARPHVGKLVGWVACAMPENINFGQMDLILTGAEEYADIFRRKGLSPGVVLASFDPDILLRLNPDEPRDIDVCFIGGLSAHHSKRIEFLTRIAKATNLSLWGYGLEPGGLLGHIKQRIMRSPLQRAYKGHCWGIEMYRTLRRSKIVLNSHIDVAGSSAGNMRMFETTGVGSFLLTDKKINSEELFVGGKEVVCYDNVDDAIGKIQYYLCNEHERQNIAAAGQQRTLRDYNYRDVTARLIDYFGSISKKAG